MARHHAILQSQYPYHITARCINQEWFQIPMSVVWAIFLEELKEVSLKKNLEIQAFVLMNNHFHLIASTPEANISECMHQLMSRTSRKLTKSGNRINETYAGRHFKCILSKSSHFLNAYKYTYMNPVKAGVVNLAQDYEFSTLYFLSNNLSLSFKLFDNIYSEDPASVIKWINQESSQEKWMGVQKGLSRKQFRSPISRKTNLPVIGAFEVI